MIRPLPTSSESLANETLEPFFTKTLLQRLASVAHAPVRSAPLPSRTFEYLDATADGMIALPRGAAAGGAAGRGASFFSAFGAVIVLALSGVGAGDPQSAFLKSVHVFPLCVPACLAALYFS